MLVGIQGTGKTTASVKLARFHQKRGVRPAIICADTYRPGAFEQLKQLADRVNVPVYGEPTSKDPLRIVRKGMEEFTDKKHDLIIVDTAGRHKDESELMSEMKDLAKQIEPDEIILAIDASIGQAAMSQATAFNEATKIGSILVTKLDGTAKGGGALSAVAATHAKIKFVGTGEKIDDLENSSLQASWDACWEWGTSKHSWIGSARQKLSSHKKRSRRSWRASSPQGHVRPNGCRPKNGSPEEIDGNGSRRHERSG